MSLKKEPGATGRRPESENLVSTRSALARAVLRADRLVADFEMTIAAAALLVGLLISLYAVSVRALLWPTAEWVLELPMELLVLTAIYGSGVLVSRRQHLSVDLVVERFSPRLRRTLGVLVETGLGLFCAGLAGLATAAALQASRAGLNNPELFHLSAAVPLSLASAGFAFWSFHFGVRLFLPAATEG
jgi:TRAP-type C4-dicarboxylate transport system permease small subunit